MQEYIKNIIEAIDSTTGKKGNFVPVKKSSKFQNDHGIIFFKPEICIADTKSLSKILEYFFKASAKFEISYGNIYVVSGLYLYEKGIFSAIYDKIYKNSWLDTSQAPYLLQGLQNKIGNKYKRVIGGLALEKAGYSRDKILEIWKENNVIKIEDDMYGTEFDLYNNKCFLINGFVPTQLSLYQTDNSNIILFTFKSVHNVEVLKKFFQGSINDAKRQNRSIRKYLYDNQHKFKIAPIFTSRNGIHMSETLLEGKRELEIFGRALLEEI